MASSTLMSFAVDNLQLAVASCFHSSAAFQSDSHWTLNGRVIYLHYLCWWPASLTWVDFTDSAPCKVTKAAPLTPSRQSPPRPTGWSRPLIGRWGGRTAGWRWSRQSRARARCSACGYRSRFPSAVPVCHFPLVGRGSGGRWPQCLRWTSVCRVSKEEKSHSKKTQLTLQRQRAPSRNFTQLVQCTVCVQCKKKKNKSYNIFTHNVCGIYVQGHWSEMSK